MRKPLICAVAPLLAAATVSCSMISGYSTDKAASYARAIELVKTNVDTDKFKIYSIDFFEREALSDDLFLVGFDSNVATVDGLQEGSVDALVVQNRAFSQTYYLNGLEPTDLDDVSFDAPKYETTAGIDPGTIDPEEIAAQIARAKTMLPEGHTFKSVGNYTIEEAVPSDNDYLNRGKEFGDSAFNRNKTFGQQHTSFVVRFTEDGKETESSAGKTSYIYYEAQVTVGEDGQLSIEAK